MFGSEIQPGRHLPGTGVLLGLVLVLAHLHFLSLLSYQLRSFSSASSPIRRRLMRSGTGTLNTLGIFDISKH